MRAIIDSLAVRYERSGSGPTVILVHGWADSLSTFYDLRQTLSKNYEVIAVDLPGCGQSSQPSSAWSLDEYANFLKAFMAKINVKSYALIGHSNGGAILIYGLTHGQLSAKKLVLIASAGIRDKQKIRKTTLKTVAKSGKALTVILPRGMKNSIRRRFYSKIKSDLLVAPNMQETFKLLVGYDVQADAEKLDLPTLIIYGQDDDATPIRYGKIFKEKIKSSKLEIVSNAGHFVHHDQPIRVGTLITDFLK